MSSLAQSSDNDLQITNGQLTVVTDLSECIARKLQNRFQLFRGEWFLDTRIGVPYYEAVLVANPDLGVIRQIFTQVITSVEGVADVQDIELDFDRSTRELSFSFRALADTGATITGGSEQDFIVEI